jgi:fibronectin type 3 domain-containing protein
MIGTVSGTAYTDRKTLPGIRYTYKVRGRIGSLQTDYSNEITVVSTIGKPRITTKAGKKKITVKWKTVNGASGYQVYQAKKKKGKYKCVGTIKKPGTTTFVKKKLKRKKKYYYKVRAFRTIGEKTVYSGFSNISYKKVK